jgi:hypothetical protein
MDGQIEGKDVPVKKSDGSTLDGGIKLKDGEGMHVSGAISEGLGDFLDSRMDGRAISRCGLLLKLEEDRLRCQSHQPLVKNFHHFSFIESYSSGAESGGFDHRGAMYICGSEHLDFEFIFVQGKGITDDGACATVDGVSSVVVEDNVSNRKWDEV